MAIREATEADLPALMPLLRGYCDFYESNPTDEGLEAMARSVIAAPEEVAYLLVATDGMARWSDSRTTNGSGRACAGPGSPCSTICTSPRAPAEPGMPTP